MKRAFLFLCLTSGTYAASHSQTLLDKATSTASAAGFNVSTLTTSITDKLKTKLGLSAVQLPKVSSAVSTYLKAKSAILPLVQTNKAAYQTKQSSLLSNLKTSLATTLAKDQMSKFLASKPATNTSSNVLSQLFY